MKRTEWIAALFFALFVLITAMPVAQSPAPKPAADAGQKPDQQAVEQPADFKAFNAASTIADARKRVEALQKFITDFPDSQLVSTAASEIRGQFLRSAAESMKQYLTEAEKYVKTSKSPPPLGYYVLAGELLRGGIMLDQAEEFALKGLSVEDEAKYVLDTRERLKAAAAERKQRPSSGGTMYSTSGGRMTATLMPPDPTPAAPREPTDDDVRAEYRVLRSRLQTTLAQVYVKRGKNAEAEKIFKDVYANADIPSSAKAAAVRALADFARKAGDDKALVQYLMEMVVAGARPDVHNEMREVYKRTHGGSLDGLETTLDEMYAKSLPTIDVKPYERAKTTEPRLVLAELFTGSECPPCVGIDLAFDAALERFKPEDLALLVYHQHIPGPDPMTNPSTEKRRTFYNVRGVPTFYIDGKTDDDGGGGADAAERYFTTRIKPDVELGTGVRPEAKLLLQATMSGSTIKVRASVANLASKSDKLRLQIVLVEERLRYHGGNGIRYHPMVVRSVATLPAKATTQAGGPGNEQGFAIPQGKGVKVDYVFDLKKVAADNRSFIDDFLTKPFRGGDKPTFSSRMDDIDPRHLVVVAFVQDEDPRQGTGETIVAGKAVQNAVPLRHVLQAASVRVGQAGTTP